MLYKNQQMFSGYGSHKNISKILSKSKAKSPMIVCDSAYEFLFIKDYFNNLKYNFTFFKDFTPNPQYSDIVNGVNLFRENNCDFIISVGGGSAIDVAKCIKLFAKMQDGEVYLKQEYLDTEILHLAIPTTAGTGSESTRFAVCYYEGAKQSVDHPSIIPDFVVLEPEFLKTLPDYQKKSTLLDAFCQGIESLWSVNSTEESMEYSVTAIKTILANLLAYFDNDEKAINNISIAANYAGKAINITQTTAAHAMSYKITSLYGIAHGHAVAVCLPYVWRYMIENTDKCIDSRGQEHLLKIFDKLNELFCVDNYKQAVYRFFRILKFLDVEFPKLKSQEELDILVNSVNPTRLKNNPVQLDTQTITEIYNNIFNIGNNFELRNIEKFLNKYHTFYDVEELQKCSLSILKKFDKFCKENNLEYFLAEGTLLGAVRHNGFIPWDDDVDILMKREVYNKFIDISKSKEIDPSLVLDCFETNHKHWTVCAKLQQKENPNFELRRLNGIALSTAPSIDIFPLDNASNSTSKNRKSFILIKMFKIMLWLKTGYSKDYSTIFRVLILVLSKFFSIKTIVKIINKQMTAYSGIQTDNLANFGSLYGFDQEVFKKEWFNSSVGLKFEDTVLPVPVGYKDVLKTIYNNYEVLPPYSRRLPKHSFFVKKQ